MSNLSKIEFAALDVSGNNYLSWKLDAEIHLQANGLLHTIEQGNTATKEEKAKAMIFLRHHLHETLKSEYLTEKDPIELWNGLKQRYDHQKSIILPQARFEWAHLRLQDFKIVGDYNSAMCRITSQLQLCGEPVTETAKLEKTFSTFHPNQAILAEQYRGQGYTFYYQLLDKLIQAEKNNALLLKNHQARPVGSTPIAFPEANATNVQQQDRGHARSRGRGSGRGRGRSGYRGGRGGHGGRGGRGGRGNNFKGPSRH